MSKAQAHVSLTVAGRNFKVAAPDGDLARLEQAARRVEALCARIAPALSRVEPERLLLLAALELASLPASENAAELAMLEASLTALRSRIDGAVNASRLS